MLKDEIREILKEFREQSRIEPLETALTRILELVEKCVSEEKVRVIIEEWYNYLPEGIISSPIQIKTLALAIATNKSWIKGEKK